MRQGQSHHSSRGWDSLGRRQEEGRFPAAIELTIVGPGGKAGVVVAWGEGVRAEVMRKPWTGIREVPHLGMYLKEAKAGKLLNRCLHTDVHSIIHRSQEVGSNPRVHGQMQG